MLCGPSQLQNVARGAPEDIAEDERGQRAFADEREDASDFSEPVVARRDLQLDHGHGPEAREEGDLGDDDDHDKGRRPVAGEEGQRGGRIRSHAPGVTVPPSCAA